ncbi:hypothetical protein NQZ68_033038, partial [Dissostichus eleginoides]
MHHAMCDKSVTGFSPTGGLIRLVDFLVLLLPIIPTEALEVGDGEWVSLLASLGLLYSLLWHQNSAVHWLFGLNQ